MKKLVLVALVFAVTPFVTFAQVKKVSPAPRQSMNMSSPTAKGTWLLGPALGFSSTSNDDGNSTVKSSNFRIQPEIGYFIADDLSVGLGLALGADQTRVDGTATNKTSMFYVAPTLRYYLPISAKFQFLGKLQVPIGSNKTTLASGVDVDIKSTVFGVQAVPAFAFFPHSKIAIELSWGSLYFYSQKQGGETSNLMGLSVLSDDDLLYSNGAPTIGVKWHFGK